MLIVWTFLLPVIFRTTLMPTSQSKSRNLTWEVLPKSHPQRLSPLPPLKLLFPHNCSWPVLTFDSFSIFSETKQKVLRIKTTGSQFCGNSLSTNTTWNFSDVRSYSAEYATVNSCLLSHQTPALSLSCFPAVCWWQKRVNFVSTKRKHYRITSQETGAHTHAQKQSKSCLETIVPN